MNKPNDSIIIYEGTIVVKVGDVCEEVDGILEYRWLPSPHVHFIGTFEWTMPIEFLRNNKGEFSIEIDGNTVSTFSASKIVDSSHCADVLEGRLDAVKIGNVQGRVDELRCHIVNLSVCTETRVQYVTKNEIEVDRKFQSGRMSFEDDEYKYVIDPVEGVNLVIKALQDDGGYGITHTCFVTPKSGNIHFVELDRISIRLSNYLSFIEGRRVVPGFLTGLGSGEVKWSTFSSYNADQWKTEINWRDKTKLSQLHVQEIWTGFSWIQANVGGALFINSLIHWYLHSNQRSGAVEGSIIMASAAIELAFNWWLIELKIEFDDEKDPDRKPFDKKLAILADRLNFSFSSAQKLGGLSNLAEVGNPNSDNFPEKISMIRNSLVHPKKQRREELSGVSLRARYECLQVLLLFVELSIIKIIGYSGVCSSNRRIGKSVFYA